jgi:acyl-coenzyme A synthetase/AMP-(fatty) acid ligase
VLDGSRENGIEKQIQAWIAERVARHKQLRGGVVIIEAIPKSPSGKILRRVLRDQAKKEVPTPQPSRASKL